MITPKHLVLVLPFIVMASAPAFAQDSERYSLEKTEDGYVRMDTRTGAMSICREQDRQLICAPAADARDAYEDNSSRLQTKVAELERRLAALEADQPAVNLPSKQDFEQSMDLMERFFRRFMDVVRDEEKQPATPDRT